MIRIVKRIMVTSASNLLSEPLPLEMIPASATLEIEDSRDENGRFLTSKIETQVRRLSPSVRDCLRDGCICRLSFDTGADAILGTSDLPLHFELQDNLDYINLKAEWQSLSII